MKIFWTLNNDLLDHYFNLNNIFKVKENNAVK
jgi:hypothetical protein